ncbi:MAG TPA: hypothetical protein VJV78_02585 [Polyangiales bacterium]|nr:hypothetical protein [Polyangiales bacterium]
MAKAMEKIGARRLGQTPARPVVRGKTKSRSSVPPKPGSAKVIKVVAAEGKKDRSSSRPPAELRAEAAGAAAVPRVEPVRLHGSEHGAAVSKTDHLKARFTSLSAATAQIKTLKRSLQKNFFEIGVQLDRIREERLYEVKGYGSFESFVERELDLDKATCIRLSRIPRTMLREAALEAGLERACAAVAALDGDLPPSAASGTYPVNNSALNTLPAHKR